MTVNGTNVLTLSYLARTNDPFLSIIPESGVDLTNWSSNGVSVGILGSPNFGGIPLQQRSATVPANPSGSVFLRLRAFYNTNSP